VPDAVAGSFQENAGETKGLLDRTSERKVPDKVPDSGDDRTDRRLFGMLLAAAHSPLGISCSVDTMKAMPASAGLAQVLAPVTGRRA
jgi:hypothetical protein